MRTRRTFDDAFKQSAIELADKEGLALAASRLSIGTQLLRSWKQKPADTSTRKTTGWGQTEYDAVASEWVSLRIADPLESPTVLAEKAQRKVLSGEQQRDIVSVKNMAPLVRAIDKLWKGLLDRPQPVASPAPPPEIITNVVTIEVTRRHTFEETLALLDEPALEALLSAKRLSRETRRDELLYANALRAGATDLPKVPAFIPKLDAFEAPRTHGPRIAVIGVNGQSETIAAEVKASALDVTLSFPDAKDSTAVPRCDFAIICRGKLAATNSDGDRVIGQLGRNRVILMDDTSTPAVMQQIRNLCSRKSGGG